MNRLKPTGRLAVLCLCACLALCGCSAPKTAGSTSGTYDYPALETVDPGSLTLAEAASDTLTLQYPSEDWEPADDIGTGMVQLYYRPTATSQQAVNINVQKSARFSGTLTEKDKSDLESGLQETAAFLNVTVSEMRTLNGEPVIYTESRTQITDDAIDLMLEQGYWTQDDIDSFGGREALLAIPATDQIFLYVVRDGWIYVCTGTYYSADQKAVVLNCMTLLMQTVESVG